MKVAIISEHASPLALLGSVDSGGQNVYVAQLALRLAEKGHEVDVFTRRNDPNQPEIYEWYPRLRVIHVPAGPATHVPKEKLYYHMDEFSAYMVEFCCKEQPLYDMIHANFWMSGMVAAHVKYVLNIPFVITFHALGKVRRIYQKEADGFPDERLVIEEEIMREADGIIAECPQDKEDLIKLYGADEKKISIIPCGFDPVEFSPIAKQEARKALGLPLDDKLILQLGRMVPRKGVDNVIEALGHLSKHYGITAKVVIVGGNSDTPDPINTPEIGRLTEVAEKAGVKDQVIFIGSRPRQELKYYYSAADVFVTTPWYEPFGITPLESMACGTPVIGANVGGIKYSVQDGATGFLVPPKDARSLARRLADFFNNKELAESMSKRSLERAQEFVWPKIVSRISDFYNDVEDKSYVHPSDILR
jgi:D-inositol-3-phosphate glycosyltransferase